MTDADKDAVFGKDLHVCQSRLTTTTPDFNDLIPPPELVRHWQTDCSTNLPILCRAARWGARHGWEQARKTQLWPEPITDRPPTEADGDEFGLVQYVNTRGIWASCGWSFVNSTCPWLHTPRWQPRQPSLKEQALKELDRMNAGVHLAVINFALIRRALEQAGEVVE